MKKFLLFVAVAMVAMTAEAQNRSLDVKKISDMNKSALFQNGPSEVFVANHARPAKTAAGDVAPYIELGSDTSDGVYEEEVEIVETAGVTITDLGTTGEYKGKTYPKVMIEGIGAGYCTVEGYVDDANGKIYIPRQVAYEYPDASKGYGKMYLEALVVINNQLDWDGTDLVLFKTENGYVAWDGTEEEGAIYGWVITMPEYNDGKGIWTYGIASDYLAANGVETGYYNWGSGYAQETHPVFIDDQNDEIVIYNFINTSAIAMLTDGGDVYIPTGQPIATMPASAGYPTEQYGEYFRTYQYDVTPDGKLSLNEEAEYTMATVEGNRIDTGEDGYIGVWSKFDADSAGYRIGIFAALNWTLNEGTFQCVTGIKDINMNEVKGNGKVYNLAGQQVSANTKGIVVVNGKKVIK